MKIKCATTGTAFALRNENESVGEPSTFDVKEQIITKTTRTSKLSCLYWEFNNVFVITCNHRSEI